MAFAPGDVVKFAEVLEPGDADLLFVVLEDRGDRVLVSPLFCEMAIAPTFVYPVEMLVKETT